MCAKNSKRKITRKRAVICSIPEIQGVHDFFLSYSQAAIVVTMRAHPAHIEPTVPTSLLPTVMVPMQEATTITIRLP